MEEKSTEKKHIFTFVIFILRLDIPWMPSSKMSFGRLDLWAYMKGKQNEIMDSEWRSKMAVYEEVCASRILEKHKQKMYEK